MPQKKVADPVSHVANALSQAVALVTGGSRGIGRAIAQRLVSLGASVAICGRDKDTLAATAAELKRSGGRVYSQPADVTRSADIAGLISKTEAALGPIAILVQQRRHRPFRPCPRAIGSRLGPGHEHESQERLSGFPRCCSLHDSPRSG
jgi:hypothetical protein